MKKNLLAVLAFFLAACSPLAVETGSGVERPAQDERAETPAAQAPAPETEPLATAISTLPPTPFRADLEDLGPAPELENETWLNVDGPLRLADLRGKVVLLDMWTFG